MATGAFSVAINKGVEDVVEGGGGEVPAEYAEGGGELLLDDT